MAANKINSKAKGSRNERDICKLFKDWTGYDFARVPSSGGLRWKRVSDTTGDITCTDQKHNRYFNFSIEAKNYKEINFEHLISPVKNCKILEFWAQAETDAERAKKLPLLFMRYNGLPKGFHFLVMDSALYDLISGFLEIEKVLHYSGKLVIMPSDTLFKSDYQFLHKIIKDYRKHGR